MHSAQGTAYSVASRQSILYAQSHSMLCTYTCRAQCTRRSVAILVLCGLFVGTTDYIGCHYVLARMHTSLHVSMHLPVDMSKGVPVYLSLFLSTCPPAIRLSIHPLILCPPTIHPSPKVLRTDRRRRLHERVHRHGRGYVPRWSYLWICLQTCMWT